MAIWLCLVRRMLLPTPRIGRYELLDHLASGGMGQVYLARATGLGGFERKVVIKTLDPGGGYEDDESFVTMFLDEARLVGALNHQFIAPVYEVGCDSEGRYYLVMDYIHGETAHKIFRTCETRGGPVPLGLALSIGSAVASALDYAHELCAADGTPLEIVHRDVSLSNVMVGYDGSVKLIDFGIAKSARRDTRTQVGTLKGKIGYLAPEQVLRRPVDRRADIFSLGIVMYELTTSHRAFRDPSDLVTFERITNGDLTPPSEVVEGYPAELERIMLRALATNPDERYQTAGAMGRDIEAFAARIGVSLGHATVRELMQQLFGGRRRLARGSVEEPIKVELELDPEPSPDPTTPSPALLIPAPPVVATPPEAVPPSVHDLPTQPIPIEIEAEATVPAQMAIEPEPAPAPTPAPTRAPTPTGRLASEPAPLDIRFHRRIHTTEKVPHVPRLRSLDRRWMVFAMAMLVVAAIAIVLALTT